MSKDRLKQSPQLEHFRVRGSGDSRLESLSDGVFALAIAMLLVSTSVPRNYQELLAFVYDAPAFAVCMIFIFWIWRIQVIYFLRYGLIDSFTRKLILALLFFVLFYTYPLKFLMTWIFKYFYYLLGGLLIDASYFQYMGALSAQQIPFSKLPWLMVIYGIGFVSIFLIFFLLYRRALKYRELLKLNALEELDTRFSLRQFAVVVLVGSLSTLLAVLGVLTGNPFSAFFSGMVYNLIWMISIYQMRRYKRELQQLTDQEEITVTVPNE